MTMPNHQPYRDWLFSEESLSVEDAQALREHLRTCEACQEQRLAWSATQHFLQNMEQAAPAAGFTPRWQSRLEAQRLKRQHRNAWTFFSVAAGAALLILGLLGWQVVEAFRSPQNFLLVFFLRLANFVTLFNTIGDYLIVLKALTPSLPVAVVLIFFTGFISMLSVLWLATLRRLSMVRRVVR